ncbi:inositol monophosphatase [Propionimicrobium lymphophilum]|nr:inositol monophosphatase [Propionimicrobium lymphophilum]MDK7709224.1 inositol monophosphatase [Propionimicrobium lymphophilum]MDK7733212.1 inositol monophosphatase [Propionimicrobium lymphophilum]
MMQTDQILQMLRSVAAEVITPRFRNLSDDQIFEKKPGDYVTVADRESEVEITKALREAYPDALIVGEEATFKDPSLPDGLLEADHAFTIDPIDGTGNYVRGSDKHAVMLAELKNGQLSRSWIWLPMFRKAYVAERGNGVFLNGQRLSPIERTGVALGGTSRKNLQGYDAEGKLEPTTTTNNCAGVDYADLLEGSIDYFLYTSPKPWDHLPGQLMLQEIGGEILKMDGSPYDASGDASIIFSGSNVERLQQIIDAWKPNLDK